MDSYVGPLFSRGRWIAVFALVLLVVSAIPVLAVAPPEDPQVMPPPVPEDFDPTKLPAGEDVAAAIEEAEQEEVQQEQWLAGPEAIQEREASQLAFADISAEQAEDLLSATFAAQLEALNSDPARFLSDAQLVATNEEDTAATVKDEGNGMVMDAAIPVRTVDEDGALGKVDLSLESLPEGFETTNALVDVSIPDMVTEPIEVGEEGLAISQQGADPDSDARLFGDENVFVSKVLTDTDLLVSPISGGVELFNLLRSKESPEMLRFEIELPAGSQLRAADGGAEVIRQEEVLAYVPPPTALDAQGTNVPVELTVEGSSLVLHVDHREGDYAMPILLDPILENNENWIYGQNHNALDLGVWGFGKNVAGMYGDDECINHCFGYPSNLRGLFVAAQSGTYWPSQIAQWSYTAPNTNSFITSTTLSPYVRYDGVNCNAATTQYKEPHDYFGIWSGSAWNYVSVNSANQPGNSYTLPQDGQSAIFGLGSGGGPVFSIPCWRDLYAGGAHVWLDDWNPPWVEWVNGVPSGWVSDETQFTVTARASDQGLGVQNIAIHPQGWNEFHNENPQDQCAGTRRDPCLTTYTATFTNPGGRFLEGERTAFAESYDPTGKIGTSSNFTMKVDKTPPDITLSGQLANETQEVGKEEKPAGTGDQLSLPVYNLTIKAEDGANTADPKTKRSGVKDIEVFLDGIEQEVPWSPQPCSGSSCSMTKTYKLVLSKLTTAGKHTLEVVAVDQVGKKLKRTIEFEYFPATGMKDEYVMHYFPLPDGESNEAEEEHPGRPELAVNVMNGNFVYREQDIDVEGPAALDLEVERYYNSQLPTSENSEWGDGWTLAQTPKLDPIKTGGSPVPNKAEVLDSSGVLKDGVALPTAVGTSVFDADLQATVEKKEDGGYELKDQTGESATSIAFDATGQTEALLSDGYAKVDYSYEAGVLAEAKVIDPATFSADPEELEIAEPEPLSKPLYASSFATNGSGDGQLKSPADVAVGAEGNLFVIDKSNNRVQKFDPSGKYLAKFGSLGSGNGQFNRPTAIAIAANGDLLIADAGNARVQRLSATGTYLSKFGTNGSGNGQFTGSGPEGIAIDPSGNIWVSDTAAGRLQKFNSAGGFLKVVGSKGSGTGQFGAPIGIDFDPLGNAWVADWENNRVSVFNNNGEYLSKFGSVGSGNGQFNHPEAIEVDELGTVSVGDQLNHRIQQFDLAAQYKGQFGSKGSGPGQLNLSYPHGIATDSKGHLWITDVNNHRIQEWLVPIERPIYESAFGANGSGDGQLKSPGDVAVGVEGNLFVLDRGNNRVEKFDPSGKYLAKFGSFGSGNGQFSLASSIAVDRDGNVWVTDANSHRIQKFSPDGTFLAKFGAYGTGNGQFFAPEGIATDFKGNIWVADSSNHRIQKLNEDGEFIKVVGVGKLSKPTGIDVDPIGNIWVADWANNRVVVFNNAGEYLSQFGSLGSANGQFNHPQGIEVDSRGNVWVGDLGNNRVQRFDLAAQYVGKFGIPGSGNGQFSLAAPMGIATDKRGHIWVTDVNNHRIQRWLLGNYLPITEEIEVESADPKVDVEAESDLISSVEGAEAGEHSYAHSGDDLVSHDGPEGETKYTYDTAGRMTKVTLPNGTWGSIAYYTDGRVKSVTVDPAGAEPAKTTYFTYTDEPRRTFVEVPGAPNVTYDIGEDGSVLKWWHKQQPPQFLSISGSLWFEKETEIAIGDHTFSVIADSPEGIASIHFVANGNQLVDEKTCQQIPENGVVECTKLENAWVTNTADLTPGILQLEAIVTDSDGGVESERFWVNVPVTPPPPPGVPVAPRFKDVLQFREDYGLEVIFPVASENELHERVFDLLHAWHNPQTPAGEVARASWERWGVPLRPEDVAEMEYREWFFTVNGDRIDQWVEATNPNTYAGYYIDHAAGGIMHIGFTQSQAEQLASLKASLPLVAGERLQVYPTTPTVSYLALKATSQSVSNVIDSNPALRELVVSVTEGEAGKTVHVGTSNVTQVESTLDQMFGSSAPIVVEYMSGGSLLSGRYRTSGRMRAGDNIVGYAKIGEPGACTAGFGAFDVLKVGSKDIVRNFVLTAGHCFRIPSGEVFRTTRTDLEQEENWTKVGQIRRNAFTYFEEPVRTDAEAIWIQDDGIVPRDIFGFDGNPYPVRPASKARVGDLVCFSGARTQNPSCGSILAREKHYEAEDHTYTGGYWVEFDPPATHGDSGAPVWAANGGASIGLVTAGRPDDKLTQTLVQPLLHPPNMSASHLPGILHHVQMQPLNLKLGG